MSFASGNTGEQSVNRDVASLTGANHQSHLNTPPASSTVDPGSKTWDRGSWIQTQDLDPQYGIQDPKSLNSEIKFRILNHVSWILDHES